MLIGVPKEIKNHEYRIGITPSGVAELVADGHIVLVEKDGEALSVSITKTIFQRVLK